METKVKPIFTNVNEYGCVSVLKILKGGENERRGFTPLTVEEMKEYAPELYPEYKAMCTPDVIAKYEAWISMQQVPETEDYATKQITGKTYKK